MAVPVSQACRSIAARSCVLNVSIKHHAGIQPRRFLHSCTARMQDTRPPEQRQLRLDQLKMFNCTVEVNEDEVEATVKKLGLHYSDFDPKTSEPRPHQLMKLTESARFFLHHWPLDDSGKTFRDDAQLTSNVLTFLVTSRMDMTEALYNVKVTKNPLDIVIQGGYIGNTSMSSVAKVLTEDGIELLSNVNHVVLIDPKTRRPTPVPDWWKTKYAKSAEKYHALKFEKFSLPENIEPYKIHAVRSDLSGYGHVDWTVYVRFSIDAIYNFSKKGKLIHLPNIDDRLVKSMELMYAGESFDEDILDVFVWQPVDDVNVAIVHIFNGFKFIFQGRFEYFPI